MTDTKVPYGDDWWGSKVKARQEVDPHSKEGETKYQKKNTLGSSSDTTSPMSQTVSRVSRKSPGGR
jgi:hypothetical protein